MALISTTRGGIWTADQRKAGAADPTLLLLHGAGGSHLQWAREIRRLAGVGVVAPDLPGHGRSPMPGRTAIDDYAADMLALLDALDIERVVIAGHSMGGAVAVTVALDHPGRVAGLIVIASGAKLGVAPSLLDDAQNTPDAAARTFVEWVYTDDAPDAMRAQTYGALMALPPGVLHGDFTACAAFDARERLHDLHTPTLIIGGSADRMTPPRYSAYLHEHIAASSLVMLNSGHMMIVEAPLEVAGVIEQWLQDLRQNTVGSTPTSG